MHITKKGIIVIVLCIIAVTASYSFYSSKKSALKERNPEDALSVLFLTRTTWDWQYTTIAEGSIVKPERPPLSLVFSKEANGVTIKTDCNEYRSSYTRNDGSLTLAPADKVTTLTCKDSQETLFLEELSLVREFVISKDELSLKLADNKGTMLFTPHQEPEALPSDEAVVSLGDTVTINGVTIKPIDLTEDSRCPAGVACITKGKAVLSIDISSGNEMTTKTLSNESTLSFAGKTVSLIDVQPEATTKQPRKGDYKFTLRVN